MCLSTKRLDSIKRDLFADLERGLTNVDHILERVAKYVPEDWHIHFDVQSNRMTIEGEGNCFENLALLRHIAKEFNRPAQAHYIADGWDGTVMTPLPEAMCIWVTNISDPNRPRPELMVCHPNPKGGSQ